MSSPSEDHEIDILNLPRDVIRRVIRVEQENIDVMRQISPQWNALVRDHFNNRKHLPVISYLCWATNDDGQTKLTIRVLERFRKYFHLNNWQIKSRISHDSEPEVEVDSGDIFSSSVPSTRTINRIFGRCSRIEHLIINMDILSRRDEMDVIKNAIIGVSVGKLEFKREFNLTNAEHTIMDLIGVTKVERISFVKRTLSPADHDIVIPIISRYLRIVSTIELASRDIDDVDDPRIPHIILHITVNQLMFLQQAAHNQQGPLAQQLQAIPQIQNIQNNQQGPVVPLLLRGFPQVQDYITDIEWRNFNDILNRDEQIRANFYEETLPNGRAKFCIDISITET